MKDKIDSLERSLGGRILDRRLVETERIAEGGRTVKKVINIPFSGGKKEEAGKRHSPHAPYRERGKKKEQTRFVYTSSQIRARVRAYMRAHGWTKHRLYDEAGAAADEIMETCFGSLKDHNIWAARMYLYPWAIAEFIEVAHEKASCYRAGELRNPITAFQAWINANFPNPRNW